MTIKNALRPLVHRPFGVLLALFLLFVFTLPARAQVMEIVKDFDQPNTLPIAALTLGNDGFAYGTTYKGGQNNEGTIFKIAVNGTGFELLKSFQCGQPTNGCFPLAGLIQGIDGFLYGTTASGGVNDEGVVFKIATNGSGFTLLKSFQCALATSGCSPQVGLTQGTDGVLYGTTAFGGPSNGGTIFKLATDGSGFTLLKPFQCTVPANGCHPAGRLIQSNDGFLYGTTYNGGAHDQGTVFKIATNGSGFTLLKSFQCGVATNGCLALAGLTQSSDNNFYGTTQSGGAYDEGSIFKIAPDGSGFAVLKSFQCGESGSGCLPVGGVVQLADGNLYGTTTYGGTKDDGSLFKIATNGTGFTVLDRFACDGDDGCKPESILTLAADGYLYSTSSAGGKFAGGTIFRLRAPVTVTPTGPTLTLGSSSVLQGSSMTANWSSIVNPTSRDWLGLYTAGAGAGGAPSLAWVYVSCSKTAAAAKAAGSCGVDIPANLPGGKYELRLFTDNGYSVLATSPVFTVSTDNNPLPLITTISVTPSTVVRGTLANVSWNSILGPSGSDWIGLYAVGAPNSPFWAWEYVSCSRTATTARASGSCTFAIPGNPPPGNYNLRLFSNNGFNQLATSNTFVLQ